MGWLKDRIRRIRDGPHHYQGVGHDVYEPVTRRSYYLDGWKLSNVERQERLISQLIETLTEIRDEAQMTTEVTAAKTITDSLYSEWTLLVENEIKVEAKIHVGE